ncbi:hypothetical protein LTR08_008911 [Meristemomyces frigidus]|nr:hypothetical protein LTR08_008911 [Meristemomyces frigidus]
MTATSPPINLMRGWPNPSLLPVALIKHAATTALSSPTIAADALLYGPDPGYQPCREAVADWLTTSYHPADPASKVTADRITITGGASQNLGCMLAVYTDPGYTRNIWIVAPAYMLAFRIFEDAGFQGNMRAVPEDDAGVDIAYLRREMLASDSRAEKEEEDVAIKARGGVGGAVRYKPDQAWAKCYRHVIYCVPTSANPSSRTMTLPCRHALVKLAREFDALVIADDVYDFLQWPADSSVSLEATTKTAHLPRLVDVDRELPGAAADGFGNACSNGSFSKIAGPGIRVGWVEGTERFGYGVSQAGTTASGGAPSQLTSTYLTHLLTTGSLQKHIHTTLLPAYSRRYHTLTAAVTTYLLPLGFALAAQPGREVVGGYFIWLALPESLAADALAENCRTGIIDSANEGAGKGVVIAPGSIFEVPGDEHAARFDGHIRLCFAWEEESELAEGVRRVGVVARGMLEEAEDRRAAGGADGEGRGLREGYVVVEKRRGGVQLDEYK